jgi:Tol biopolymer transport system component
MVSSSKRLLSRYVFIFIALLVLAACGEVDPDADPRVEFGAQPDGRILFAKDGDVHVWDGDVSQLTDYGDASSPVWSPNGDQFLFVRTGDAFSDILLANADSGVGQRLTANQPNYTPGSQDYLNRVAWALDPAWSPTGNGVAYVSDAGTSSNFLWHRTSPTSDPWRVPCSQRSNDNVARPHFAPDGARIVFAQRASGQADLNRWMELKICDLNSGELVELLEGDSDDSVFFPRWSPDGDWIAFVRRIEGRSDIWAMSADGGEPVQLTELGDVTAPEWSPDGNFIGFMDPDGNSFRVAVMEFSVDADGTPSASDPNTLFSTGGIDPASGISWTQ